MKQPVLARSPWYQPDALVAIGSEMLRNGGNCSAALRTIFPELMKSASRTAQIAVRVRRQPIVAELMAKSAARALIAAEEALNRYGATSDRTAEEMARLAFAQMRDFVDWGTEPDPHDPKKRRQFLRVRDATEINEDAHKAVVEITRLRDGTLTIKMGDKLAALNSLARLKGWIADKPQDSNQLVSLVIQR